MDSQVLRLIRRYDPVASNVTTTTKARPTLDNIRGVWHTVATNVDLPIPTNTSPLFSRRALTTNIEEQTSTALISTPRLQRQEAIQEHDASPTTATAPTNNLRPILKYSAARSKSEFYLHPYKNESINNDIDSGVPSPSPSPSPVPPGISFVRSNESPIPTKNEFSTMSKRICSALSKSELDLRLQRDSPPIIPPLPFPIRPPSPPVDIFHSPQEREPSASSFNRSKSSLMINSNHNEQENNADEMSAPINSSTGSYVEKLKQLLVRKSSIDTSQCLIDDVNSEKSIESSLEQRPKLKSIESTSVKRVSPTKTIEPPPRTVFNHNYFPRTVKIEETNLDTPTPSSLVKKVIFRSQKTIDE